MRSSRKWASRPLESYACEGLSSRKLFKHDACFDVTLKIISASSRYSVAICISSLVYSLRIDLRLRYISTLDHRASIERVNLKLKKKIDVSASTSYNAIASALNTLRLLSYRKNYLLRYDGTYEIQKPIFRNFARLGNEVESVSVEAELEETSIRRLLHLIYNWGERTNTWCGT